MPGHQKFPKAGVEDFVPWVPPISSRPPDWEEEEEDDGMSDLIHNFATRKRKRDANFKRVLIPSPEWPKDRVGLSRMRVRRC